MMYTPGYFPSSSKYMESPNFENDSIPIWPVRIKSSKLLNLRKQTNETC